MMRYENVIWLFLLCFTSNTLWAQSVRYSTFVNNESREKFEVVGKTKGFYWVHKDKIVKGRRGKASSLQNNRVNVFEVYDERLHRVSEISSKVSDSVVKQYLLTGTHYFDQLLFVPTARGITLALNRYLPDGSAVSNASSLFHFPAGMKGDDFLIVRSPDKTKTMLVGFEMLHDTSSRVHTLIWNEDWKVLHQAVHDEVKVGQPFIQYDFTNYALEYFDGSPVKILNNGDWVMVAPSRRRNNYLFWHFRSSDSSFSQSEIKQGQGPSVQNYSLSIDDNNRSAFVGLLVNTGIANKKVRIVHYELSDSRLKLDTTYRFRTTEQTRTNENYFSQQDFIPVAGRGFLYLKEYGKRFFSSYQEQASFEDDDGENLASDKEGTPITVNKRDYTRYRSLSNGKREFDRGDLNVRYFPVSQSDSCWSGLLNMEQSTDISSSYLSYACVPVRGKLIILYNTVSNYDNQYSSSTVLNAEGNPLNEGLVFWRASNVLNFQKARLIDEDELAVPYNRNGMQGFAIVRL